MRAQYSIKEWPVLDRPRERLWELGAGALATRELLGILIGSGSSGRTAVEVAGDVLQLTNGSLRRLATLAVPDLERVGGIGPAVAARLSAALELGRRLAREGPAERIRIGGPRDVYERCAPAMRDLLQEEFRCLILNTQHAVIRELVVTRGTVDTSLIHPREVFRAAVADAASAVILVHNHPSGDPTPSREDRDVTRQLVEAGKIVGIPVIDHIIVGDARYVSFVEAGLLTLE